MQTIEITQDMVVKLMLEHESKVQMQNELFGDFSNKEAFGQAEGFLYGMEFALTTLGIYIDGINYNAEEVQTNVEDNEASRG